jgi:hypothetical protein
VNIGESGVRFREIRARFLMIGLVSSPHHAKARGRQIMAATTEIRTFWSALLNVLLKCIAALGLATPAARAAAARTQAPVADRMNAATVTTAGGRRVATGHGLTGPRGEAVPRIPAPRGCEPVSRDRDRTLPPTMKQRIRAEAHGSSPSARSIRAGELEDITAGLALAGAATGAATTSGAAGN